VPSMLSLAWITTCDPVSRLRLGIIGMVAAVALLATASGAWSLLKPGLATPTPGPFDSAMVAQRGGAGTVEDLPHLKARLDVNPAGFMGGVLVAQGNRVLFRQLYGQADVERNQPLSTQSRFRLASISKQFTAAAVLKLQDEGRLRTTDAVCKWIEPCPEDWGNLTVAHLLSHRSGIPDLMARPGWGERRVTQASIEELTTDTLTYSLQFPPGSGLRYNNASFNLAADIVERVSGMPFATYLELTFFKPLGMKDTGLGDMAADGSAIAMGYANLREGLIPQTQPNVSIVIGAGALYSTLDDVHTWMRALHHGKVLSEAAYTEMTADHAPPLQEGDTRRPERQWGYGVFVMPLGIEVQPSFVDRQIFHTGSWAGFRNLATYQPDQDVTVIVLSNSYYQREEVLLISQQALAEVLGHPVPIAVLPRIPAQLQASPAGAR